MRWLTIEKIKQQSRLDYNNEDELLEGYGESAEDTILNICNRTYEDLIEEYGKVPAPLVQASVMLVEVSYQYRSPVSEYNLAQVPYAFDMLVKPYIRLADDNNNNNEYGKHCNL